MSKYKMTPARRAALHKAQAVSARKRRGYGTQLVKFVLSKGADTITKGGASKVTDFFDKNEKKSKKRTKAKRKAARRR